jgi:hypothetical protein
VERETLAMTCEVQRKENVSKTMSPATFPLEHPEVAQDGLPGVHLAYVAIAVKVNHTERAAWRKSAVKATAYTLRWCLDTSITTCKSKEARGILDRKPK